MHFTSIEGEIYRSYYKIKITRKKSKVNKTTRKLLNLVSDGSCVYRMECNRMFYFILFCLATRLLTRPHVIPTRKKTPMMLHMTNRR